MSLNKKASKTHLIIGICLIIISLISTFINFVATNKFIGILIFFFGVWGAIETGRFIEMKVEQNSNTKKDIE